MTEVAPIPQLVVAVTGHRPDKLGGYDTPNPLYDIVVKGLVSAFELYKPAYVITGMALGVDQWAAEICINMEIPFVAALPFRNQDQKWLPKSKAKFHWLLSKASHQYVICDGDYEPWKMQERNKWMINSCHLVVAVWNGTTGGTANCLGYAHSMNKQVYYVPVPSPGMEVGEWYDKTYGGQKQPEKIEPAAAPGTKRIVEL